MTPTYQLQSHRLLLMDRPQLADAFIEQDPKVLRYLGVDAGDGDPAEIEIQRGGISIAVHIPVCATDGDGKPCRAWAETHGRIPQTDDWIKLTQPERKEALAEWRGEE